MCCQHASTQARATVQSVDVLSPVPCPFRDDPPHTHHPPPTTDPSSRKNAWTSAMSARSSHERSSGSKTSSKRGKGGCVCVVRCTQLCCLVCQRGSERIRLTAAHPICSRSSLQSGSRGQGLRRMEKGSKRAREENGAGFEGKLARLAAP